MSICTFISITYSIVTSIWFRNYYKMYAPSFIRLFEKIQEYKFNLKPIDREYNLVTSLN